MTLKGDYGARTSLSDPEDLLSSVLYVAAPVMVRGEIAGALTVIKPTTNINSFLKSAKPRIVKVGVVALLAAIVLGFGVAMWITRPIRRMTEYAHAVSRGRPADFPILDRTEIGTMGRALRKMQTALEGKAYVERYVQQLTHEVKSPLSAIRGSAELLEEEVPADRRIRFLNHIRTEAGRIQNIVDRMLTLASLENKSQIGEKERIDIADLIDEVVESKQSLLLAKNIAVRMNVTQDIQVNGDRFWLRQAVANLIQNAIDFSAHQGTISIASRTDGDMLRLFIEDTGAAIPTYALTKVFDKFYSLKRPDDGRKSTGLGLNLVKQVALLHQGDIQLQNRDPVGRVRGVKPARKIKRTYPLYKIKATPECLK